MVLFYKRTVKNDGKDVDEFAIAYRGTDDKLEWILTNPSFLLDIIPNQFDDAYIFANLVLDHVQSNYQPDFGLDQFTFTGIV